MMLKMTHEVLSSCLGITVSPRGPSPDPGSLASQIAAESPQVPVRMACLTLVMPYFGGMCQYIFLLF